MSTLDRPRLRPLSGHRIDHDSQAYLSLQDPLGCFPGSFAIRLDVFQQVVRRFDGRSTLDEVAIHVLRETGRPVNPNELEAVVLRLDRAMVLDGPTFAAFRESDARQSVRPAAMAGRSYPAHPDELRAELDRYFVGPGGSGSPAGGIPGEPGRFRGILSPHIDFGRGGPVYTWAYRELIERSEADVFVILGVAHRYCQHRFALTRKDFATPLGVARTDREFVDRLAENAGSHLFEDELAHRAEHSIEFQVVFLQHLLGGRRDFTIVPILVGSFHDLMLEGRDPIEDAEVRRMVDALRLAEKASGRKVAYIGGIDLCHVGPEFGDSDPVSDATLGQIRSFDEAMLDGAIRIDPAAWFSTAARVENRWRVCGLATTYTMLQAIGPAQGRLLRYDQAVNPSRTCCVSFASVVFDTVEDRAVDSDG